MVLLCPYCTVVFSAQIEELFKAGLSNPKVSQAFTSPQNTQQSLIPAKLNKIIMEAFI